MSLLKDTGYLTVEELLQNGRLPSEERYAKGPVAILECTQDIPCNPCEEACPFGAIYVGKPITNLPVLDEGKCTGCGNCIPHCSGLAVFVVDKTYSEMEATVSFPYEYLPLPIKGQVVKGLDRTGKAVCEATVVRVVHTKKSDHTPVITIAVPKEYADEVRNMSLVFENMEAQPQTYVYEPADPDTMIVCRCEEVTVGEIRKAIREGAHSIRDVKRITRAGMGLCQGRTCSKIISRMIAVETGKHAEEIVEDTARPPMKPVQLGTFLEE